MSIQKITFSAVLDYLATKNGTRWNMVFQASQFDLNDFSDSVNYGNLTLNLSPNATRDMQLSDTHIYFKIRKHGIPQEMYIPYTALMIIEDPDDPSASMAWPYFLDHGDDYVPDESAYTHTVELPNSGIKVQLKVPSLSDFTEMGKSASNVVQFPGGTVHIGEEIQMEPRKTLQERMAERGMSVIEGGGVKVLATIPWIDEVHRAKQARREAKALDDKNADVISEPIRSDGSKGNSVFFPDLDVSKCYFPIKRTVRPEWLKVIDGGKNVASA